MLAERLSDERPLLLDGALGTELERRGARCDLPLWSARALLEDAELVRAIHADYVAAGAELLTANTFRTQRRTLARGGLEGRAGELTLRAVELAREAAASAAHPSFVLGSAATLEDCYRPELVPDAATLTSEHAEHARHLAAARVDGILIETLNTVREARAAVRAAVATGLPVLASFVCDDRAHLLSGEPLAEALQCARREGATVLLVNCIPPSAIAACLPALRTSGLPFGVYANLGEPTGGGRSEDLTPEAFAAAAIGWLAAGARIAGGCCGTTPAHVRAIASQLHTRDG